MSLETFVAVAAAIGLVFILVLFRRIRIPSSFMVRVLYVYDGDTIRVRSWRHGTFRVRIAFMDAPEGEQEFGEKSAEFLRSLVWGRRVLLKVHDLDYYGRFVAQVFVNGEDAGLRLIAEGLAYVYRPYLKKLNPDAVSEYWSAQRRARSARLGVWSSPRSERPWDWRARHRSLFARMLFFLRRIWRTLRLVICH